MPCKLVVQFHVQHCQRPRQNPSLSFLPFSFPSLIPPLPLEVVPIQLVDLLERCELPQRVWGRAPVEIEFGAFYP